jgi:putative MATE family efflux protein
MGGHIVVRTGSLLAAFVGASAVLARVGPASLAAHQIAFQLFVFLALVLDAIAIAGQVIVGRSLGAGDAARAREAAARMIGWSFVVGIAFAIALLAAQPLIPHVFTDDARVVDRARAAWPLFAAMQPVGAVVFALDGILLGAGDSRYLAASMAFAAGACFIPLALAALHFGWGIVGVWVAIDVLMLARLATTGGRFLTGRWAVVGAPA